MDIINSRKAAALLAVFALSATSVLMPAQAQTTDVDPAAVKMLKGMTEYMRSLQSFSVHTQNTLEHVLDSGQRIDEDTSVSMTLSRPDKLQANRLGGLINQVFYYDGKTLTLNNQKENVYAKEPAPATIEEMLDHARESLGLIFPASDLVYRNVYPLLMQDVTSATVVGKTVINETTCHHLAFSRPDVDFQVWVADAGQPLPCKYVVTDKSTSALVSTTSVFSNWNVKPSVSDSSFSYVPAKGAMKVTFMPLDTSSGQANDSGARK